MVEKPDPTVHLYFFQPGPDSFHSGKQVAPGTFSVTITVTSFDPVDVPDAGVQLFPPVSAGPIIQSHVSVGVAFDAGAIVPSVPEISTA
jgi:hypothetical protein